MEKNQRIFQHAIRLLLVLTMAGAVFLYSLRLKEPVVIKQYQEVPLKNLVEGKEDPFFQLRMLTNGSDGRTIQRAILKGPQGEASFYLRPSLSQANDFGFGHGEATMVGVPVGPYLLKSYVFIPEEPSTLEEALYEEVEVFYENGERFSQEIGLLSFYEESSGKEGLFTNLGVSSSSSGASTLSFTLTESIEVIEMTSPLLASVVEAFTVSINGKTLEEIQGEVLEEGSFVLLEGQFVGFGDPLMENQVYDLRPVITYEDVEGARFTYRIHNLHHLHHAMDFGEVLKYLRKRGALAW